MIDDLQPFLLAGLLSKTFYLPDSVKYPWNMAAATPVPQQKHILFRIAL